MKVKKKYFLKLGIAFIVLLFIAVCSVILILWKTNISFERGTRFISSGFRLQPASTEEIENYNLEFSDRVDILHYELNIDLFPTEKTIKSEVVITGIPKTNFGGNIELNFYDGFDVDKILINNRNVNYDYDDDKIEIYWNRQSVDTFEILISYAGTPESLGFGSFNFGEYDGHSAIYTLNEPIFASTWFPCKDIPSDKVLADVFITNDSSMTSVSNGLLIGTEMKGDRKTFHWKTNYPISTYLISIYSARYKHFQDKYLTLSHDSMKIDYYVFEDDLEDAKIDFKMHPSALRHFSELFGEYPFVREKYGVAQFLWNSGAMEHQTITGIGKNFVSGSNFYTGMLVPELAHQWWGNAVTLASWKDIWLNEGFATYSEALYWERESGFSSLKSTMQSYLTDFNDIKLYDPKRLFSRTIYNKGAWVLHMLRKELGEKLFFSLLREYYIKYKYKNASTKEFIDLIEKMAQRNFKKFFDQWVFTGEGKIELEYYYNQYYQENNHNLELNIFQIQETYSNYNFILEIDFYLENGTKERYSIRIENRKSEYEFQFGDRIIDVQLDPDSWLAADIKYNNSSD